jgi:hypothetical protein
MQSDTPGCKSNNRLDAFETSVEIVLGRLTLRNNEREKEKDENGKWLMIEKKKN